MSDVLTPNAQAADRHRNYPNPPMKRLVVGDDTTVLPVCLLAAALCLAIALAHIQDQGGFLGDVSPSWIAYGYYAVEASAAVTMGFLVRQKTVGWLLGIGVSAGPFTAYILSRSVGIPGDSGDIGNWGYTLGTVTLILEAILFFLSVAGLARAHSADRRNETATGRYRSGNTHLVE